MPFLDDLRRTLEMEQTLTPQRVCELIADGWGGERVYIQRAKEAPDVRSNDTVQSLMARGVKRSTAYNWVNRWKT